jgi:Glycosyl transferases group 1/Glycosyltransferase Family 4
MSNRKHTENEQEFRIAINAQLFPGQGPGGIESALIGLIHSLGCLDGPEKFVIVGHWKESDWLQPYLGKNQSVVTGPAPAQNKSTLELLKRLVRPLKKAMKELSKREWPDIPISQGFYEDLGCELIHFPFQQFVLCSMPSIFNPHDLQHRHFPQFFTPSELAWRETLYRGACQLSHAVAAGTQWVKDDIIHEFDIPPEKIQVIPWAPPTQAYAEPSDEFISSVRSKYGLPLTFAFYPAVTWEHKNHIRLFEALASLRDRDGLKVHLVCTGYQYPQFWPRIEETIGILKLQDQVQFLGIVPGQDLRAIYRSAQFVAVPTLFEAASGPVFEAWQEETPVTCSNVTALPEQARDAAIIFDPYSIEEIAAAVGRLATDPDLRGQLILKGKSRLKDFSWERTAKAYRALYRRIARRSLTDEDEFLLSWDWMGKPHMKREGIA